MSIGKQLLILCILAGIAYGGYEAYEHYFPAAEDEADQRPSRPVPVELVSTEIRQLAETVEAVGTTRARQSVSIVPEDEGRVIELAIAPGGDVNQGDILVRLDDAIQRADLAEARARVTERLQALDRVEQLLSSNAVAQATLEDTTARLAEARAQLDRAEQRFADRTITAPFDGVVGLAEIDPGAWVDAGDMITTLDDLSEVVVEFSLPETLFSTVKIGQHVTASSAAFSDRHFEGRIEAVDSRIDPIGRSFRTRAAIPNPDRLLPAGMFMSLTLTLSERDALVVPEEAIIFQAAETYVFVVDGETARRVPVITGQRRDGIISIEKGLDAGTQVIVRGLQRVSDGRAVVVVGDIEENANDTAEGDS